MMTAEDGVKIIESIKLFAACDEETQNAIVQYMLWKKRVREHGKRKTDKASPERMDTSQGGTN